MHSGVVNRLPSTAASKGRTVAGLTLRDYQVEALEAMETAPDGAHLVQMATGLGKTVVMGGYRRQGRLLILSHRDELVHQPVKYFEPGTVGIERAHERSHGEEVVSASVQTLSRGHRLDLFPEGYFDAVITDEAHHAIAPSYRKIIDHLRPRLHFGLTATPRRGDDRGLSSVFEDIIFQRDLKWGIRHGYLTDIDCRRVTVAWDTSKLHRLAGDYNHAELSEMVDLPATNEQIAEAYRELRVGQTLVFASSVRHARALSELIPSSVVVDGKTPTDERRRIITDFTARKFDCLINYGVFTEGTDMPLIETVLIARPTQNPVLYTQMVGRGLRLNEREGKECLRLIDCVGVSDDKRLCTAPTLFGMNEADFPAYARAPEVLDGSLMGLEERIDSVADSPTGWVLNARHVDVLNSLLRVAWACLPDGSRSISGNGWEAHMGAPDLVDHVSLRLRLPGRSAFTRDYASVEEADAACAEALSVTAECLRDRNLWDRELVERWAHAPASARQIELVRSKLGRPSDVGLAGLTKYQAQCIIQSARRHEESEYGERFGHCPVCGCALKPSKHGANVQCMSNRWTRDDVGRWVLTDGCGTSIPMRIGKAKLEPAQVAEAAETGLVKLDGTSWALVPKTQGSHDFVFRKVGKDGRVRGAAEPKRQERLKVGDKFFPGERLVHEKLGVCSVVHARVNGDGRYSELTLKFDSDGRERDMALGLAPLYRFEAR